MVTFLLRRGAYRVGQFVGALRPNLHAHERAAVRRILGQRLYALFESMGLRDQRHCYDVYLALQHRGCSDRDLLAAALLHDAGKGRMAGGPVRLWHRVAYVILAATAPSLLHRLTRREGGGLATLHRHAEVGAQLAQSLGASPRIVEAIRQHEDPAPGDETLRLLRIADDSA